MAELGIARFEDLVGRVDLLVADDAVEHWKARGIDLSNLLHAPDVPEGTPLRRTRGQDSPLESALDWELIELAAAAIEHQTPVSADVARAEREPHGGRASVAFDHGRARREGTAGRDGPVHVARVGGAVVRRVARARCRADALRRRERLHR